MKRLRYFFALIMQNPGYWYLTAAPELLNAAGRSFATFSQAGKAHDE
ncbi:MAG: hypothetical protein JO069_06890 [Verrucomicrobia bacterium]|nr:hypothetical protein [Verrucomicrobiota bacterium]